MCTADYLLVKVNVSSKKGAAVGPIHWVLETSDGKRITGTDVGFEEAPKLPNGSIATQAPFAH